MTNVVTKGTNRPAAAARSAKHAQRTPLPPKHGVTEEMLSQARHVAELQGMTVPEMRRYAKANSISIPARISKADLLKTILLAEEEKAKPVEVEKPAEAERSSETPEAEYRRLCALPISLRTAEQRDRIRALKVEVIERNCAVSADVAARATSVAEEATTEAEAPETTGETSEATTEQQSPSRVNVVEIATKRAEKAQKASKPRETRSMARTKLLEERKAKAAEAKVPAQRAPEKTTPAEAPTGGTKSEGKAAAFIAAAAGLGWEATRNETEGELTSVTVARGEERIEISWQAGVFIGETCLYYHPGRNAIKVHNASAAKKRMAMTPEECAQEAGKVAAHRARTAPRESKKGSKPVAALPFSETSLDSEVIDAVRGRTVVWTNSISGRQEEASVPADGKRTKQGKVIQVTMKEGKAGRSLCFTDESGTRSVRVASITEVR